MILENDLYYCESLSDHLEENISLIQGFHVSKKMGIGLERYVKESALGDEINHTARTYLVKDKHTHELVGYFSLKAGMVAANLKFIIFRAELDEIPAIELANFAINDTYKASHIEAKGLGEMIFYYFILPIARQASEYIGVHSLYIFALPFQI